MFDSNSRYYGVETTTLVDAKGREIRYVRRRFLPPLDVAQSVGTVTITQGDRLDVVAARTLGDPELFWILCDANGAMNPNDLTSRNMIGRKLKVPAPQAQETLPLLKGISG